MPKLTNEVLDAYCSSMMRVATEALESVGRNTEAAIDVFEKEHPSRWIVEMVLQHPMVKDVITRIITRIVIERPESVLVAEVLMRVAQGVASTMFDIGWGTALATVEAEELEKSNQ